MPGSHSRLLDLHARDGSSDDEALDLGGAVEDRVGPGGRVAGVRCSPLTWAASGEVSSGSDLFGWVVGMKVGMLLHNSVRHGTIRINAKAPGDASSRHLQPRPRQCKSPGVAVTGWVAS
jgi:hypothetical protein